MPIYDYKCEACGESFDELVKLGTPASDVECPECGEYRATQLFSATSSAGGVVRAASRGFVPSEPAPSCAPPSAPKPCGAPAGFS